MSTEADTYTGVVTSGEELLADRVERDLRSMVAGLQGSANAMLPKEADLAETFGVSVNTVRRAMRSIKRDGLVRAVQGRGTFVVPRAPAAGGVMIVCNQPDHPYVMLGVGRGRRQFTRDPHAVALAVDALGKAHVALDAVGAER